ncbi:MAG: HlyD family efflux transporter periplasmic adaptor subunit [Halioglobus sp.]|nr:HlyD family efflux transporter periplasmic adaptor subunit [Halioglobus sp.]
MSRCLFAVYLTLLCINSPAWGADSITCLGRVEPLDGVRVLAGPSGFSGAGAVLSELRVEEGDWVEAGHVVGVLDGFSLREAELQRQQELLEEARVRLKRLENLSATQATSRAKLDEARYSFNALQAEKKVFEARLEMTLIRAPQRGQVLEIYSYPGEKIGPDGVVELGETDKMTVVAEVYETDVGRLAEGQRAVISSPALNDEVTGKVVKIGYRVGKMDVLDTDPVANTDARVVEAIILVDDSTPLQRLTNLQVDVKILP